MQFTWTTEQILGLAQDQMLANAGLGLAQPDKWRTLGKIDQLAWGLLPNGTRPPHQITIILPELIFNCTCNVQRAPCRHALGLMLLLHENPAAFAEAEPPEWGLNALGRDQQQRLKPPPSAEIDIDPQRLQLIKGGMEQLALWLRDMLRDGLATLPARPQSYWQTMADRLKDAHASDIATDLITSATLIKDNDHWPELLLPQIGRLYLLTQGYANYDSLSPAIQADLRMAVGWIPKRPTPDSETIRDHWLVLGRQSKKINKQFLHRTWLWGHNSQRPALLLRLVRSSRITDSPLVTGSLLDATLTFHPSSAPLAALLTTVHATIAAQGSLPDPFDPASPSGGLTIEDAMARRSRSLAKNPWLRQYPFIIQATTPHLIDNRWWITDSQNRALPLPPRFKFGWHLRAISDGNPFTLFGEWRNDQLSPLSGLLNGRWLDLHVLRGGTAPTLENRKTV